MLGALGWLDTGRGDFEEETLFERAYTLARYVDDEVSTAHNGTNLAELHLALGRLDEAREVLEIALERTRRCGSTTACRTGSRRPRARVGCSRAEEAARLLGAADGLREEVGVPIWGPRLTRFESLVAIRAGRARRRNLRPAWAEGRALGYDAALALARGVL